MTMMIYMYMCVCVWWVEGVGSYQGKEIKNPKKMSKKVKSQMSKKDHHPSKKNNKTHPAPNPPTTNPINTLNPGLTPFIA